MGVDFREVKNGIHGVKKNLVLGEETYQSLRKECEEVKRGNNISIQCGSSDPKRKEVIMQKKE